MTALHLTAIGDLFGLIRIGGGRDARLWSGFPGADG